MSAGNLPNQRLPAGGTAGQIVKKDTNGRPMWADPEIPENIPIDGGRADSNYESIEIIYGGSANG